MSPPGRSSGARSGKPDSERIIVEEPPEKKPKLKPTDVGTDAVPTNALSLDQPAPSPAASQGGAAATSQGGTQAPAPPMPVIDTQEDVDVVASMRKIVPYTIYHLRLLLNSRPEFKGHFPDGEPASHQPLEIKSEKITSKGTFTSYKAPWTAQAARDAAASTGMFEASANALWLNPHPPTTGEERVIAGALPCWKDVEETTSRHFSADARQATPAESQGIGVQRIMFPVTITAHVDSTEQLTNHSFPSTLRALSGHVYIYALYYAMFKAIQEKDYGLLASLWQACLTTTINCRIGLTPSEQALLTMAQSESAKAGMELQSDSFLFFAAKALLVLHQSMETNKLRVRQQFVSMASLRAGP